MSTNQGKENLAKVNITEMMNFLALHINQVIEIKNGEEESYVFKGNELVINYHSEETQVEEI